MTKTVQAHHYQHHQPKSILLLEDELRVAKALGQILCSFGYRVKIARDVPQAKEIFLHEARNFQIFIADYGMRGLEDGLSFLAWIKEQHPQSRRILISGLPLEHIQDDISAHCHAFLAKPFDAHTLKQCLNESTSFMHFTPLQAHG